MNQAMLDKRTKISHPYQVPEGFFEQFPEKSLPKLQKKQDKQLKVISNIKRFGSIAAGIMIIIVAGILMVFSPQIKNKQNGGGIPVTIDKQVGTTGYTAQSEFVEEELTLDKILTEMSEDELTQWTEVYLIDMFYQTPL
jgi:hypothetical protein